MKLNQKKTQKESNWVQENLYSIATSANRRQWLNVNIYEAIER